MGRGEGWRTCIYFLQKRHLLTWNHVWTEFERGLTQGFNNPASDRGIQILQSSGFQLLQAQYGGHVSIFCCAATLYCLIGEGRGRGCRFGRKSRVPSCYNHTVSYHLLSVRRCAEIASRVLPESDVSKVSLASADDPFPTILSSFVVDHFHAPPECDVRDPKPS